jgi:Putative Flp pilus-assembly TadE/G-like
MKTKLIARCYRTIEALRRDRRAAVSIIVVAMMTALVGIGAFAMELGQAYMTHTRNQRVADAAAYGAAVIYTANNKSTSMMNDAVTRLTSLNGLPANSVTASIVSSPTGDGYNAVKTQASTSVPLQLAKVFESASSMTVTGDAYAELITPPSGCMTALGPSGTGISVTGGASVSVTGCAVASNGTVPGESSSIYVHCGATITAAQVDYASTNAPVQDGCTDINPPTGTPSVTMTHATSTDLLASNTEVTNLTSLLSSFPTAPTVSVSSSLATPLVNGNDYTFNWNSISGGSPSGTLPAGCSAVWSTTPSANWTVTCATGTYHFGKISVGGGISLNWNLGGSASSTYTFADSSNAGDINLSSGSSFAFGPGTYEVQRNVTISQNATFGNTTSAIAFYVEGTFTNTNGTTIVQGSNVTFYVQNGLVTGGGTTTTLGAGTYKLGASSSNSCNGSNTYSICNTGSILTIQGPSTFVLAGGIYNNGGETLLLGTSTVGTTSPTTNSFNIGKAADGNSIAMGGGAKTTLADATGTGDVFQLAGNLNVTSGGGSCLVLSASPTHYIKGNFATAGGSYLGSGTYVINGYVGLGTNGGGDVSCTVNGTASTIGLYASSVSFVIGGATTVTCNSIASSFCVSAGYGHVTITAPTSGSEAGVAVVGPTSSSNTSSAVFNSGASNTSISGVFYYPNGTLDLSGAAALHSAMTGACLELSAAQINVTAGGSVGAICPGLATSAAGPSGIALVK